MEEQHVIPLGHDCIMTNPVSRRPVMKNLIGKHFLRSLLLSAAVTFIQYINGLFFDSSAHLSWSLLVGHFIVLHFVFLFLNILFDVISDTIRRKAKEK